jgi:hypothetical protein
VSLPVSDETATKIWWPPWYDRSLLPLDSMRNRTESVDRTNDDGDPIWRRAGLSEPPGDQSAYIQALCDSQNWRAFIRPAQIEVLACRWG